MSQVDFGIQVLVSTKNARAATRQLQKDLGKAGAAGQRAGSEASRGMDRIGSSVDRTTKNLQKMFVAFGGIFVLPKLIGLADAYEQLQNRVRVVTNSTEELAARMADLELISEQTRSSLKGSTELYVRLSLATKEMGISSERLLGITKSVNQAIIVSGASAKEAENGLIQLSQGLASGALRGDELRSVLEQLPRVADVIASSMGVTRGELRKLGEQGLITSEAIIKAFEESSEVLEEDFGKTVTTFAQSWTMFLNKITEVMGKSTQVQGALQGMAKILEFVGNNFESIITAISTFLTLFAVNKLVAIGKSLFYIRGGAMGVAIGLKSIIRFVPGIGTMAVVVGLLDLGIRKLVESLIGTEDAAKSATRAMEDLTNVLDPQTSEDRLADLNRQLRNFRQTASEMLGPIERQQRLVDELTQSLGPQGLANVYEKNSGSLRSFNLQLTEQEQSVFDAMKRLQEMTLAYEDMRDAIDSTAAAREELGLSSIRDMHTRFDELSRQLKLTKEQREFEKMYAKERETFLKAGIDLEAKGNELHKKHVEERIRGYQSEVAQQAANKEAAKQFSDAFSAAFDRVRDKTQGFLESLADMNDQIRQTAADFGSAKLASEQYLETVQLLDAALGMGLLTQDEYNAALTKLANDALPEVEVAADAAKRGVDDLSTALWEGFAQTALSNTENAIADFVVRGRGNFKAFVTAVMEDLLRMITRLLILLPLINALKSAFGNVGGGTNLDAGNAMYGDGFSTDQFGNPISNLQNGGSFLVGQPTSRFPGFANGGSMMVGGNGGTDSQLVAFRASPNERVTVTRPEQSIGGNTTVNVSVHNNAPGTEARVEQGENGSYKVIIEQLKSSVASDISRGGTGLNAALEGRYGLNGAAGIQLG